jgi:hypothetical protein
MSLHVLHGMIPAKWFRSLGGPGDLYTTKLARWCHPSSEMYKGTCDIERKIDAANADNSFGHRVARRESREPTERDVVTVFLGD